MTHAKYSTGPALLFCPANRPERFAKAAERADTVILDLEDAVGEQEKDAARQALIDHPLNPERTIVRINPVISGHFPADLRALAQTEYRTLMLAKTEDGAVPAALPDYRVIALCETARGIANVAAIAATSNVVGLMWGAEDLIASFGGTSSRGTDGSYRQVARYARAQVLIHAAAHGKAAIDSVYLDIPDTAGLLAEAQDARASGFTAKACIHPSQVPVIRRAYYPDAQEAAAASRILRAATENSGVFSFEGQMIDEPVLRQARATLAAWEAGEQ
ncbi:CoA ester lyase [Glutamicibacter sp. PS]|uniref:HpcH/HpaI aldolase/citrate lyase family protein n=1 Tax=Glutamicibacter sp. PS TaxID=3075634 RepID=UPI002848F47B|nr:CoA ester lyase [Glutamicibacter sp. PS]MDR4534551.1 CoA ester lyase [Glutamicibacter sp. PS]